MSRSSSRRPLLRRAASFARKKVRTYFARRVQARKEAASTRPILIYTMPKVGSSTIWATLRARELPDPVYHMHSLQEGAQRFYRDALARGEHVANYQAKLAEIEHVRAHLADPNKHWKVITLVRDPVARALSSLFQARWKYFPDIDFTKEVDDATKRAMRARLHDKLDEYYELSATWFHAELQTTFDFDVFATPFDRARGYATYGGTRGDLLVFRLDDLDRCHEAGLAEFLGLGGCGLVDENRASTKAYYNAYRQFSRDATFPPGYLDKMYEVPYVRHFYSADEIAAFKSRWPTS